MTFTKRDTALLIVSLLGLALAVLSGFSEQVAWLHTWCTLLGDGCRVTRSFTLLSVPVWIWGAVFYGVLALAIFIARNWLDWLIPVGLGVEAALLCIMKVLGVACIYCMGNAAVMLLLAFIFLPKKSGWQTLALALLGFMLCGTALARENNLLPWYCARNYPAPTAKNAPPEQPKDDTPKHADIPIDGSQTLGPDDAPVTIIEYSDFRCPACRRMHKVVDEAMKAYGDKVRWVFKNLPLPMHKDAEIAAEAAQCAAARNKFWEYQEVLFTFADTFTPETLGQIAQQIGLDAGDFNQCLLSHSTKAQIDKEVDQGLKAGLNAVPTLVINGQIQVGTMPIGELKALIDAELAAKRDGKK